MTGKREPYGRPSTGCGEAGPVEPWQPPSTLAHTTNQRSVSIGRPGPTMPSHHPGVGWPRPAGPVTWLSPVQAWQSSTALLRRRVERAPRLVGDRDVGQRRAPLSSANGGRGEREELAVARRVARHPRTRHASLVALGRDSDAICRSSNALVAGSLRPHPAPCRDGNGTLGRSPRLPGPQAARNAGRNLPAGADRSRLIRGRRSPAGSATRCWSNPAS